MGRINKLSINNPISVSTLIFFQSKLYVLHNKATPNPTQGNVVILNNKYKVDAATNKIDIILCLFNFSFKKRNPKKTLKIGNIK